METWYVVVDGRIAAECIYRKEANAKAKQLRAIYPNARVTVERD